MSLRTTMPGRELEDLILAGNRVTALSDRQRIAIRVPSKSADDARFVHDTILYRLG